MPNRLTHDLMALRVSSELRRGQVVNLGIGLPTLVSNYVTRDSGVVLHTENGVLGYGPQAAEGEGDPDTINARGEIVRLYPGAAIISHNDAFGIARSGQLDVAVLGALQVSENGDLANWMVPDKGIGSPGGALDLAAQAKSVIIITEHTTRDNSPKILKECTYPLTVKRRVGVIVTDVAVMAVAPEGLILKEVAPGWTADAVQAITEANLKISPCLKEIDYSFLESKPVSKIFPDANSAVADVFNGATVVMDGFGGVGGMAHYLMVALRDQGAKELTLVSNTAGIARVSNFGKPPSAEYQAIDHSILVEAGQIKKAVASFPVSPSPSRPSAFEKAFRLGEVEVEVVPQGTLAERLRAGAYGIAAFYTPTGVGTVVAQGKETRLLDGRECILEKAIRGNFALIRAKKADTAGNLVYTGTSRNFNAVMAKAADVTIAEVDEIVDTGDIDPNAVITPGLFVHRIVQRPSDFSVFQPISQGGTVG